MKRRKAGQRPKVLIDEIDLKIVMFLSDKPKGLLVSGLADYMNMPMNTILERIKILLKKGLITKTKSTGRAILIQLKPEYQSILSDPDKTAKLLVSLEDGIKGLLDFLIDLIES